MNPILHPTHLMEAKTIQDRTDPCYFKPINQPAILIPSYSLQLARSILFPYHEVARGWSEGGQRVATRRGEGGGGWVGLILRLMAPPISLPPLIASLAPTPPPAHLSLGGGGGGGDSPPGYDPISVRLSAAIAWAFVSTLGRLVALPVRPRVDYRSSMMMSVLLVHIAGELYSAVD